MHNYNKIISIVTTVYTVQEASYLATLTGLIEPIMHLKLLWSNALEFCPLCPRLLSSVMCIVNVIKYSCYTVAR